MCDCDCGICKFAMVTFTLILIETGGNGLGGYKNLKVLIKTYFKCKSTPMGGFQRNFLSPNGTSIYSKNELQIIYFF